MADANHVIAAGIPFSGFDVLFSAGVGTVLLVAAVGARVVISRRRLRAPQLARPQRAAESAPQRAAASG